MTALSMASLAEALAADAQAAFIHVDRSGTIRAWNAGAEAIFGHAAAEAIGQRADLIVPASLRAAHWAGFHRAMASGWTGAEGWGPVEALHRTGTLVATEVFLLPIAQGTKAAGALAIFRRRTAPAG